MSELSELKEEVGNLSDLIHKHIGEDAAFQGKTSATLDNIHEVHKDTQRRLFGNGQPGELSSLKARISSLETRIAFAFGASWVLFLIVDKVLKVTGILK